MDIRRMIEDMQPGRLAEEAFELQIDQLGDVDELLCLHCGTESVDSMTKDCMNPDCRGKDHPVVYVFERVVFRNIHKAIIIDDEELLSNYIDTLKEAYDKKKF